MAWKGKKPLDDGQAGPVQRFRTGQRRYEDKPVDKYDDNCVDDKEAGNADDDGRDVARECC